MSARTRRRVVLVCWISWVLMIAGGIAWLYPRMKPVHEGTPEGLWWLVLQLAEDRGDHSYAGSVYAPRDGWFVYTIQSFHDEHIYRVDDCAVRASFPGVLARLEDAVRTGVCKEHVAAGYTAWRDAIDVDHCDPAALVAHVRAAEFADLAARDTQKYGHELWSEQWFEKRWECWERYRLNGVLEFAFLVGLMFFAVGPWTRLVGTWALPVRCGLLPFLFLLPFCLGYATWTFTSRGPSGGILYPWLIAPFNQLHDWFIKEEWVLIECFPRWLLSVSQPHGAFLSISGRGYPGPLTVIMLGLAFGALAYLVQSAVRSAHRHRERR